MRSASFISVRARSTRTLSDMLTKVAIHCAFGSGTRAVSRMRPLASSMRSSWVRRSSSKLVMTAANFFQLAPSGIGRAAGLGDGANVGAWRGVGLAYAPERAEGGIGKLQPAVGPEDGNALGKVVDRFALDLQKRVVAGFEIDLLGQVVEYPGRPALRMGVGEDIERLAVRQMPEVRLRVDGVIDGERLFLELAPRMRLRQLAVGAQALEELGVARPAFEKRRVEVPEPLKGLIVEFAGAACCRRWRPGWPGGRACRRGCAGSVPVPRAWPPVR